MTGMYVCTYVVIVTTLNFIIAPENHLAKCGAWFFTES